MRVVRVNRRDIEIAGFQSITALGNSIHSTDVSRANVSGVIAIVSTSQLKMKELRNPWYFRASCLIQESVQQNPAGQAFLWSQSRFQPS